MTPDVLSATLRCTDACSFLVHTSQTAAEGVRDVGFFLGAGFQGFAQSLARPLFLHTECEVRAPVRSLPCTAVTLM